MYLASRSMIPTHNSTLALDFARAAAIRHSMSTVLFSLEMGRNEITMRLLAAEARVPLQTMRTGQMNDDDWARLARRMSEVADAPLFIDHSPNMSMMEIRAKCRRVKQRHDLKFVIVDYLQLMSSPAGSRTGSRRSRSSPGPSSCWPRNSRSPSSPCPSSTAAPNSARQEAHAVGPA